MSGKYIPRHLSALAPPAPGAPVTWAPTLTPTGWAPSPFAVNAPAPMTTRQSPPCDSRSQRWPYLKPHGSRDLLIARACRRIPRMDGGERRMIMRSYDHNAALLQMQRPGRIPDMWPTPRRALMGQTGRSYAVG